VLFATGAISLALEVVWTRAFTPVLQTTIYSFALLLAVYLLATWVGSALYRADLRQGRRLHTTPGLMSGLAVFALLPVLAGDPRRNVGPDLLLASIFPFCAALGYLTPRLVDEYSRGAPRAAGNAYALNTLGCIVGPLVAGYMLLPLAGVRLSMVLLAVPFWLFYLVAARRRGGSGGGNRRQRWFAASSAVAATVLFFITTYVCRSYEDGGLYRNQIVFRDHTATVIAHGEGLGKAILVNGVGMTTLTPITKMMAHLPLSMREEKPSAVLVICFGMGTTFRSLMRWDIEVSAVELVPGVVRAFPFFHADANDLLRDGRAHIVIDDGRRFLDRTERVFDLITIDPPPPVEAAGSSLLYSREFYRAVKRRLGPEGILQQWVPGNSERAITRAVIRSVMREFPHVKTFRSIEGWGTHILASRVPLRTPTVAEMIARMPADAQADLVEWYPGQSVGAVMRRILDQEQDPAQLLAALHRPGDPDHIEITDDRPFNEYFWLRRYLSGRPVGLLGPP
jgi:spermidine synthase